MQTLLEWQKADQWLPEDGDGRERRLLGMRELWDGNVHYVDCGDGFPGCIQLKRINFNYVSFTVCQLYLNNVKKLF